MPAIPENPDARWHIWNTLFLVRIPYLQSRSKEHLKHFGMPTSGDPRHDDAMRTETVTTMKTIRELIDLHQDGVSIAVLKEKDTKLMYEYITDHLNAWRRHVTQSINPGDVPLEDLQKLDAFAQVVYPHAVKHCTTDFVDSVLARRMNNVMISREQLLPPRPAIKIHHDPDAPPPAPPTRESMAAIFASREIAGKPKW